MPLLHCNKCDHEWESSASSKCDWCGASSHIIEEETQFEKFCRSDLRGMIKKWIAERSGVKT